MCSGSNPKCKLCSSKGLMGSEFAKKNGGVSSGFSVLLELAASDDLAAFKSEVEGNCCDLEKASFWYCRRIGSRKMGVEEMTPLMVAAMFGSVRVLKYVIESGRVDVNRAYGSDRVTALHCAVAGGASSSVEVVKLLLDASADAGCVDANGNKPIDLVPFALKSLCNSRRKAIELVLKGDYFTGIGDDIVNKEEVPEKMVEKKEYPNDVSLPDINEGLYGTDEFRMYTFKVKPCSRAYSHDWTICPFVHPGENARRRDPSKYPYSCVPCPEFRKGSCPKGDECEYAHGVFESWLHPAQYRTRLCKDEICNRKVCFFAHKKEELRPVYASTGSAMPSQSPAASTPPMSPLVAAASPSPKSGGLWKNNVNNISPPALQLPGSRLKTAFCARDLNFQQQKQLMDEMSGLSSPTCWNLNPTNLEDTFGSSFERSMLSPLNSLPAKSSTPTQRQLRSSYPTNNLSSFGFDSSAAVAAALMNSRSSAFANRSQSFIDRGAALAPPTTNWSSPDGKLDWGIQGDELNKLRKSASFGFRSSPPKTQMMPVNVDEPDVSWVNSLVRDGPYGAEKQRHYGFETLPPWVEKMYIEQEQMA